MRGITFLAVLGLMVSPLAAQAPAPVIAPYIDSLIVQQLATDQAEGNTGLRCALGRIASASALTLGRVRFVVVDSVFTVQTESECPENAVGIFAILPGEAPGISLRAALDATLERHPNWLFAGAVIDARWTAATPSQLQRAPRIAMVMRDLPAPERAS